MRRLLTMTFMAVTPVGVTLGRALAGGAGRHFEGHYETGYVVEPITETESLPVERTDPAPVVVRPVPFDGLGLTIVGVVGLLPVIRDGVHRVEMASPSGLRSDSSERIRIGRCT